VCNTRAGALDLYNAIVPNGGTRIREVNLGWDDIMQYATVSRVANEIVIMGNSVVIPALNDIVHILEYLVSITQVVNVNVTFYSPLGRHAGEWFISNKGIKCHYLPSVLWPRSCPSPSEYLASLEANSDGEFDQTEWHVFDELVWNLYDEHKREIKMDNPICEQLLKEPHVE
jgi:hypothetical protein